MKFFIVTKELGDGDVSLEFFSTREEANNYISFLGDNSEDYNPCFHESNPHEIDTDNLTFTSLAAEKADYEKYK